MSDFELLVGETVNKYNMLCEGDRVVVALSGGADSVSLFYALLSLRERFNFELSAAHVNHNLRGDESLRDMNFVKKLCSDNSIELYCKSVDVSAAAKEQKISTELCGRNIRYEFFEQLHNEYDAKIATAHTMSDNAETVLFNLVRGTGLKGMCGILPVRDYIIRPLIDVTRQQVENYCEKNNLSFVTDSTNLSNDYTRNIIRHDIVPRLKNLNPNFEQAVGSNSKIFTDLHDYMDLQTDAVIARSKLDNGYDANMLSSLDNALCSNVVCKICKLNGVTPQYHNVSDIIKCLHSGGAVDISKDKRAVCKQNLLRIIAKNKHSQNYFEVPFRSSPEFDFNSKHYSVKEIKPSVEYKNLDSAIFRTRRAGDTFTLPRRNITKTVKKLFNELKIPEENRDELLLLASGSTVLWIETVGFCEQGRCNENFGIDISINEI